MAPSTLLLFLAVILLSPPPFFPAGDAHRRIFARAIPSLELEAMEAALRQRGYHLFPNAIMTSDLRLRLLDGSSFTIFAPTDASLFSYDMASDSAADYLNSLLFHISPVCLTLASLRSLPSPSSFPSLLDALPHRFARRLSTAALGEFFSVDGVGIVEPGIFYGPSLAVHGLDGMLDYRRSDDDGLYPPVFDYDPPAAADVSFTKSPVNSPSLQPEYDDPSWDPSDFPSPSSPPPEFAEGSYGSPYYYIPPSESPVGDYGDDPDGPSYPECVSSSLDEICENIAGDSHEVVDGGGDMGFHKVAAGEETLGKRRKRLILAPAGPAPSTPFEVISISSEPPMYAANDKCPAVDGEGDARSAAASAKCAFEEAKREDAGSVATADDIEISLRRRSIQPPSASEDLL